MDQILSKQINIRANYNHVIDRITQAARNSGCEREDIRLVVVTKTQPINLIQAVINAGAIDLGENYVEEAIPKIEALAQNHILNWHMIGHIQRRKAENVCQFFHYIHSIDSVKIAERINRFATDLNKLIPVWLEFNVSGEESKSGWNIETEDNWENILPEIEKILTLPQLNLLGLMTMPPYFDNPEASRPYYQRLRKFQDFILNHFRLSEFRALSMGMSSDFEVAIQEGSTCVRIGQAIFGPRL